MRVVALAALCLHLAGASLTTLCANQTVSGVCVVANTTLAVTTSADWINGTLLLLNSSVTTLPCTTPECSERGWILTVFNDLVLTNGSTLFAASAEVNVAGAMRVDASSAVRLDGLGPNSTANDFQGSSGNGGGNGGTGASCYGDRSNLGNGVGMYSWYFGGGSGNATFGVPGGGRITLNVGSVLELRGVLSANGASAPPASQLGGGAGGTILVSAPNITLGSTGKIQATGGEANGIAAGGEHEPAENPCACVCLSLSLCLSQCW